MPNLYALITSAITIRDAHRQNNLSRPTTATIDGRERCFYPVATIPTPASTGGFTHFFLTGESDILYARQGDATYPVEYGWDNLSIPEQVEIEAALRRVREAFTV